MTTTAESLLWKVAQARRTALMGLGPNTVAVLLDQETLDAIDDYVGYDEQGQ